MALNGVELFYLEVSERSRQVTARLGHVQKVALRDQPEDWDDEQQWLVNRLLSRPQGVIRATAVRDTSVEDNTPAAKLWRRKFDCARKPGY